MGEFTFSLKPSADPKTGVSVAPPNILKEIETNVWSVKRAIQVKILATQILMANNNLASHQQVWANLH